MTDAEVLADLLRDALPEAMVEVGADSVTVRADGEEIVWRRDGRAWACWDTLASTEGAVRCTLRWLRGVAAMDECAGCGRRSSVLHTRSGVAICEACRDEADTVATAVAIAIVSEGSPAGYGWIVEDDGTVRPNRDGEAYQHPTYTAALERALAVVRTERDALRRGERP